MSKKIAAVVVTFNRSKWLIECLEALIDQTRQLDCIYVVDNNSTDDTREQMIKFCALNSTVIYHRLLVNTGSAGGFAFGMKLAYESGFDWLWLMDDDVEPYSTGLFDLLKFSDRSKCIHGKRTEPDGSVFPWGSKFDADIIDALPLYDSSDFLENDVLEVNVGCFEGMLVHREVVDKIGFPLVDLFITWDDTYFGYCASQVTKVLYVNVNVLKRKRTMERFNAGIFGEKMFLNPMTNYYHHRNRYLLSQKIKFVAHKFWFRSAFIYIKSILKCLILQRSWVDALAVHKGTIEGLKLYLTSKGYY